MNITFYADNIDPRIPAAQKAVFEAMGQSIVQVKPDSWEGHGGTIDRFLADYAAVPENQESIIVLWDIDCIPLNPQIIEAGKAVAKNGNIIGVAQKASHIPNSIIYAGPAFLVFSIKTWNDLGRPTFACTGRSDCAGELTHIAQEKGVNVHFLYPTHVEESLWPLTETVMFGKGTTFQDSIYHAFYSRKGNIAPFLKKCDEVLSKYK